MTLFQISSALRLLALSNTSNCSNFRREVYERNHINRQQSWPERTSCCKLWLVQMYTGLLTCFASLAGVSSDCMGAQPWGALHTGRSQRRLRGGLSLGSSREGAANYLEPKCRVTYVLRHCTGTLSYTLCSSYRWSCIVFLNRIIFSSNSLCFLLNMDYNNLLSLISLIIY